MKDMNWEHLRVFLAVAKGGSLSAAAKELGMSVPTAGRHMTALEEFVGQPLFVRSRTGYGLTRAGGQLLQGARKMEAAAKPLEDWVRFSGERTLVRISAGTTTAAFMAENFAALWKFEDPFRIAFVTTEARLDITHREVDIGIRNQPAASGNLASRKMQELKFAPFRNRLRKWSDEAEWVAVDEANARHPAARWVLAQPDISICAYANTVATMRELVRGGAGIGIMPCFAADRDPQLERAGPLIEELTETQWLVMHNDDRARPEIRTVIDRVVALFASHASLMRGERPIMD